MPPSRLELFTGFVRALRACAMSASPFRSDHTWYAQYMARERAGEELPS